VVGPGSGEVLEVAFRLDDHQVHVERLRGRAAHRLDERRTEGDVRHEPSVHDVDVDPVGAGRSTAATSSPSLRKSAARIEGATISRLIASL
jgi:hypothetical protein